MRSLSVNGINLHWREDGDPSGQPIVFANSLGTDLRLWDDIIAGLPEGYRAIRYDKRGHGLSDCPPAPYSMEQLVADAEGMIDALGLHDVIFIGLSIGGMIGQGLAAKRPDLIRALVLSNTAAKMGTPEMWQSRMAHIREGGLASMADAVLERWFAPEFRASPACIPWGHMLCRTPVEGYLGCCAAIAEADLSPSTRTLRLPVLAIAGELDGASPPDLVRGTADMIADSQFHIIPATGHLPCVEDPETYSALLADFLKETAHV